MPYVYAYKHTCINVLMYFVGFLETKLTFSQCCVDKKQAKTSGQISEREGGGGRGGIPGRRYVLDLMHGRSDMTIDPRIPTMTGRSMSGFHWPGRRCVHQARSAVRCPASRMKGELHPIKNRLCGGLAYGCQLQWVNLIPV